jgi:hypothetical protein
MKRQRSRAMEMRYFGVGNKVSQDIYSLSWHPEQENLGNYQSKHNPGAHHTAVRPYYLHESYSPIELPHAVHPSTLKGCVGALRTGTYITYPYCESHNYRVLVLGLARHNYIPLQHYHYT